MHLEENLIKNSRILVCGDFILDQYVEGIVERISPEAPVPVLKKTRSTIKLGGAANVAANCAKLGVKTVLLAVAPPPSKDFLLKELLENANLSMDNIVFDAQISPVIKTRFMADGHHILRVDEEEIPKFSPQLIAILVRKFEQLIQQTDVIVFSDYAKGFFDPSILFHFLDLANRYNKKVLVDPKGIHYAKYRGCFCIKPNKKEAYIAANCDFSTPIEVVSRILMDLTDADYLLITRSAEGMSLFSKDTKPRHVEAFKQEIVDVVGAGDTALALLAVAISVGMSMEDAMILANAGSSIAVSRQGCVSVSFTELEERLERFQKGQLSNIV